MNNNKVMIQEEKAKAYDEILVKAKELKEANPSDEGIQRWVDDTFPELAESEEDKSHINFILELLRSLKNKLPEFADQYQAAFDFLKSIRPQNRRNPSEEHYELEEFAKIVRSNLTGISKAVQELFEAKYLQLTGNKMYKGFKD